MKYFTKEWQQRISEAPESAQTLANEANALYCEEQKKIPFRRISKKALNFTMQKLIV